MQYSIWQKFLNFTLFRRKQVVFLLSIIVLSSFFYIFGISFAKKIFTNDSFDEIQILVQEFQEKDKELYNVYRIVEEKRLVKGIDVSSWQGVIDWEQVSQSGIDFVMIRCGFRNLTNPTIEEDRNFKYNISEANKYNIPVGIYFYSTAITPKEALEEASFVLNLVEGYKITYPIVYDFELFNDLRTTGIKNSVINQNALLFLEHIESHGYNGMLYFNLTAAQQYWNMELFAQYKLWFAHYLEDSIFKDNYDMWQYADNGRIPGITGYVDLNEAQFAYTEIVEQVSKEEK